MDESEFPSNSRNKKEPEKKAIEKVITGTVSRRKQPLGKRFMKTFVGGEAKGVWQYIVVEVLVPAIKDLIVDTVEQGVRRTILGDGLSSSRRASSRSGHVSYNRYSSSTPPWKRDREEPRNVSRRARSSHDFDEIILATRGEADEVISRLFDLINQYQQATVADLYELVGIAPNFTDERWGWTDLRGAGATRVNGGYLLDISKPEQLD